MLTMKEKEINAKIEHLQELLTIEKKADLEQYVAAMDGTSYVEQRRRGVCWYPVSVSETKYDAGERLLVCVNRPKEHDDQHSFQSGKLIRFFSGSDPDYAVSGVVNYVRDNEMMFTLNCDDVPDWINIGKLGVQLLFDENSYKEMEYALNKLLTTEEDNHKRLKDVLLGDRAALFDEKYNVCLPNLNESQNRALCKVLNAQDVAIVHGPPGTGKTTTLVQAVLHVLKDEPQVLVTAPSNAAVDLLVEKLRNEGVRVVRIGHPAKVTEEILGTTLDAQIVNHDYYKDLKSVRRKADELHRMAHQYKRNFGQAEREQRRELFAEARRLQDEASQLTFYITNDILSKAEVIASTLVGSANQILRGRKYRTVFIDEAAQSLEPTCWIPMLRAERVVFAGDHCQLPPTIKSYEAAKGGLSNTLFEKAIARQLGDVMLEEQYRMNSAIMEFSSRMFYDSRLKANNLVNDWRLFADDLPIEFIDTAGTGFFEQMDEESKSIFNKDEADLLMKHFVSYTEILEANGKLSDVSGFGVIAPYRAQITLLQERFADLIVDSRFANRLAVNTIDSFQGQERDVIYISLTRSNEAGEIGFLSDIRRMNVAITRARKKLVIVGDSATIGSNSFYDKFITYVTELGAYRSAFEFIS